MQNLVHLHPEIIRAQKFLDIKNIIKEPESEEYCAYKFQINQLNILFRVAKTTPTKAGQFVTLWKRIGRGPIMPYDESDPVDVVVISVCSSANRGYFVFSRDILIKQQVFSREGVGGKRAIRVYPPWERALNAQALKTQKWQGEYFLAYDLGCVDLEKTTKLFFRT